MALRSDLHGQELVAVKDGVPAEDLRHEAALLGELDHPGIIRFVALTEGERGPRLLTRYAGRETLATWQPRRLEEFRRVIEDLAGTVAYLHERGVVHRSIDPSHVVIDALRRPLLCSFSSAHRVAAQGTPATERPGIPGGGEGDADGGNSERDAGSEFTGEQLGDVMAIGETALSTLRRLEGSRARSSHKRDDQRMRERLQAVAEAAAGGRVPSARALAGQIRGPATGSGARTEPAANRPVTGDAFAAGARFEPADRDAAGIPGAKFRSHPDPRPAEVLLRLRAPAGRGSQQWWRPPGRSPTSPLRRAGHEPRRLRHARRRPRRATLLAVAAVCGGCALGTLMVMRLADAGNPPPVSLRADLLAGPVTTTAAGAGRDGRSPARDGAVCKPIADGFRDVTGDGCAAEIDVTAGFVWVDGARYPIGAAGDQVAVGDWDCDGIATVALAQPGGRVYVFDSWPLESPLVGRLVADLPPPVRMADVPRGACNELLVHYAEGTWHLPLPSE